MPEQVRIPPGITHSQWVTAYRTMALAQIMLHVMLVYFLGQVILGVVTGGIIDAIQIMYAALMILAVAVANLSRKGMGQAAIQRHRDQERLKELEELQSVLRDAAGRASQDSDIVTDRDIAKYLGHKVVHLQRSAADDDSLVLDLTCSCGWDGTFKGKSECDKAHLAFGHYEWVVKDARRRLAAFEHELRSQLGMAAPEEHPDTY